MKYMTRNNWVKASEFMHAIYDSSKEIEGSIAYEYLTEYEDAMHETDEKQC